MKSVLVWFLDSREFKCNGIVTKYKPCQVFITKIYNISSVIVDGEIVSIVTISVPVAVTTDGDEVTEKVERLASFKLNSEIIIQPIHEKN